MGVCVCVDIQNLLLLVVVVIVVEANKKPAIDCFASDHNYQPDIVLVHNKGRRFFPLYFYLFWIVLELDLDCFGV